MLYESHTELVSRFENIISDVIKKEINDLECAVTDQDGRLAILQASVSALNALATSLAQRCEDLEGRSRMNNVRLVGVPEVSEGSQPTEFVASLGRWRGNPCLPS